MGSVAYRAIVARISDLIALEDLFLLGLGLDIVGAGLLLKSVTVGYAEIAALSGSYWGANDKQMVARAVDRLRGKTAGVLIVLGFLSQALGYLVIVGRRSEADPAGGQVVGGLLVVALAVVSGLVVDRVVQRVRLKDSFVELARYQPPSTRHDRPVFTRLLQLGEVHWPRLDGESDVAYLRRVFPKPEWQPIDGEARPVRNG